MQTKNGSAGSPHNGAYITAKDISKRYKVAYPTINHYTNLGFFSIVKRSGNKRLFNGQTVKKRLEIISKMADEGYPLSLIKKKIVSEEGGLA
jgi:DNA-binding transcriptional MerR regulator